MATGARRRGPGYIFRNTLKNIIINKYSIMEKIQAIKPGPKPKKEDGSEDQRRRINPETKPKHPDLKPHVYNPKD